MRYRPPVEVANFTCKFGTDLDLIDLAEGIVIPALANESWSRTVMAGEYRFIEVRLQQVQYGGTSVPAITGTFVRSTTIESDQVLLNGQLQEQKSSTPTARSSVFILLLHTHKLVYVRYGIDPPGLAAFENTAKKAIEEQWKQYIKLQFDREVYRRYHETIDDSDAQYSPNRPVVTIRVDRGGRIQITESSVAIDRLSLAMANVGIGAKREILKNLRQETPSPIVSVIPLANSTNVSEIGDRFQVLKSLRIDLAHLNSEVDMSSMLAQVRQAGSDMNADRMQQTYASTQEEGLDKGEAIDLIAPSVTSGQANVELKGIDQGGNLITATNKDFRLRTTLEQQPTSRVGAITMGLSAYADLLESNTIDEAEPSPGNIRKAIELRDRLNPPTIQIDSRLNDD